MRGFVAPPNDHYLWVILQQVVLRGSIGIKFILIGRLIGTEGLGLLGIALIALSIAEALSDTGLPHAIVQQPSQPDICQMGVIYAVLLIRGICISFVLYIAGPFIATLLGAASAAPLISTAAALPLVRCIASPGFYLAHRHRNFRGTGALEIIAALFEFFITMILVVGMKEPSAVILGAISGSFARSIVSWLLFPTRVKFNLDISSIRAHSSYGKWIWMNGGISLMLNQLDKILVARILGPAEFGLYQMAYKIAQMGIADLWTALGQFYFPTFSRAYRKCKESGHSLFYAELKKVIVGTCFLAVVLGLAANWLVDVFLGFKWAEATPLIRALIPTMGLGAVTAILAVFSRAVGRPKLATQATLLQLILLAVMAPLATDFYGTIGMAFALAVSTFASMIYLILGVIKIKDT